MDGSVKKARQEREADVRDGARRYRRLRRYPEAVAIVVILAGAWLLDLAGFAFGTWQ